MESLGGWMWLRAEDSAATTFRNSWWMLAAPWQHETLRGWWMVATDWRLQRPVRQWGCLPCVSERVVEFALRCVKFLPLLSRSFTLSRVFPSLLSRSFTRSHTLLTLLSHPFLHCSPSLSLPLVPFLFCTLNALVKLFFSRIFAWLLKRGYYEYPLRKCLFLLLAFCHVYEEIAILSCCINSCILMSIYVNTHTHINIRQLELNSTHLRTRIYMYTQHYVYTMTIIHTYMIRHNYTPNMK